MTAVVLDDNEVTLAAPAFDQPPSPLRQLIVLAATARSGSYMLARMLKQLGYGIPLEYFNPIYIDGFARRWGVEPGATFRAGYLDALIRYRTVDGVCATKCMSPDLGILKAGLAARGGRLELRYVHIWRRDSLAQAISLRLAYQSGVWNFTSEPTTPPNPDLDVFDLDALRRTRRELFDVELKWRIHLRRCGHPVLHVAYEDLIANRTGELRRIVAFLDPARPADLPLATDEPATGEDLRARQLASADERVALRAAYVARFGAGLPLPEP